MNLLTVCQPTIINRPLDKLLLYLIHLIQEEACILLLDLVHKCVSERLCRMNCFMLLVFGVISFSAPNMKNILEIC